MAAKKVMLGVALIQMVLSFTALMFCSKHYYDSFVKDSTMPTIAPVFAMRLTPLISLMSCAAIGLLSGFLDDPIANAVYLTANAYTSYLLTTLIWYLVSYLSGTEFANDKAILPYCITSTVLALAACLGYIMHQIVKTVVANRKSTEEMPIVGIKSVDSATTNGRDRKPSLDHFHRE